MQGGKARATEPVPPPTAAGQNPTTILVPDQKAQQLDSAPESQEAPSQTQNPGTLLPPGPAQTESASSSLLASTVPSQQGPSPAWVTAEQPAEVDLRPTPDSLPSLSAAGPAVRLDLPCSQDQQKTTGSPAAASNSQLGSTVAWNSNQGELRILLAVLKSSSKPYPQGLFSSFDLKLNHRPSVLLERNNTTTLFSILKPIHVGFLNR